MQKFLTLMSGLILTLSVSANDDYEQVLKRYEELKPTAEEILVLANFITNKDTIKGANDEFAEGNFEQLERLDNASRAINSKKALLGDVFTEPFASCVRMINFARTYYAELRTDDNSNNSENLRQNYESSRQECKDSVVMKPERVEKNEDLAIIDLSPTN